MSDTGSTGSVSLFRIRGDILATARDEHGQITVIENKIYRVLTFDRICEQSKLQRSDPALPVHNYIRAMLMVVALTSPRRSLVLGLGGGCLLRSLFAHDPQSAIDAVELRPTVIDMARRYFFLPESEKIHYYASDAEQFIRRAGEGQYDVIFSDLYAADSMSPLQAQESFLYNAARTLSSDGWLVVNYPQRPAANSPLMQALRQRFTTLIRCVVPSGNVVVFASNVPFTLSLKELQQRVRSTGHQFRCDFSSLVSRLAILSDKAE